MTLTNIYKLKFFTKTEDGDYEELFMLDEDDIVSVDVEDTFPIKLPEDDLILSFQAELSGSIQEYLENVEKQSEIESVKYTIPPSYLIPILPSICYCTYEQLYTNNFRKMHHIPMIRNKKNFIPSNRPILLSNKAVEWLINDINKHEKY